MRSSNFTKFKLPPLFCLVVKFSPPSTSRRWSQPSSSSGFLIRRGAAELLRRAEAAALRAESDGEEGKHGGQKHPSLNKRGWGGVFVQILG